MKGPAQATPAAGSAQQSAPKQVSQPPAWAAQNQDEAGAEERLRQYGDFSDQASELYRKGQLEQAIQMFEKARAVAPRESLPTIHNNLAVAYIRQGNYFNEHGKQLDAALNNYRKAWFYMETAWPEGVKPSELQEKNRYTAKVDLDNGYVNANINPNSKDKHLTLARQLRMQGKFIESIVEYEQAYSLDKHDADAAKAMGDLFILLSLPDKAQKYYELALNAPDFAPAASHPAGNPSGNPTAGRNTPSAAQDELLTQLGNAQYKTGDVDKAVTSLDKALVVNPDNVGALNLLEKIWSNEVKFNPSNVVAHANLGSVYQKQNRFREAEEQYSAAETLSNQQPNVSFDTKKSIRLNLGTLYQANHQYDMAKEAYNTVLKTDPNNPLANFYMATLLDESGNIQGAWQAYDKTLAIDPSNEAARRKMLAIIKKQPDPVSGLKQYADRFSRDAQIQEQMGEEFHQRKDLDAAAMYYQRAINLDPNMTSAWVNLGAAYQTQGRLDDSAQAYARASALAPDNPTFKDLAKNVKRSLGYQAYQQAVTLQQQGRTQDAIPLYQQALQTEDSAEVHAAYGTALQAVGKLPDAVAQYQQAINKDSRNADYAYYLGTAYHQQKNWPQAKAAYEQALRLKPDYPEVKTALAEVTQAVSQKILEKAIAAYNQKNYTAALQGFDAIVRSDVGNAMAYYYQGLTLDAQKKPQFAIASYRNAIRTNPGFNDAYYALGLDLDAIKNPVEAKVAFEKFLELSGNTEDDFVKYARERVKKLSIN